MKIPKYITKSTKPESLIKLFNEALYILDKFGVPVEGLTRRRQERIAMAFLAVANIRESGNWQNIDGFHALKTRDIIRYWNTHFYEEIADSSYDDIRRKDLKPIVLAEIIFSSAANPNAARNDGTRAFALNTEYIPLIRSFGDPKWLTIEQFLPRYGYGAEVLYVGDSANKFLHLETERLNALNFFELSHGELPDIVAYSVQKNWIYLIEAVHSSGAISPIRLLELKKLTEQCQADIIFITAFLDRNTFRQFLPDIAWETEVWIADAPDHLIHFDGEKFLGSYSAK